MTQDLHVSAVAVQQDIDFGTGIATTTWNRPKALNSHHRNRHVYGKRAKSASIHEQCLLGLSTANYFPDAPGYVTRIAAGVGVGLGHYGHTQTMLRNDVVVLPLAENERITSCVLHKRQRFKLAEPVECFLAHVSTLSLKLRHADRPHPRAASTALEKIT